MRLARADWKDRTIHRVPLFHVDAFTFTRFAVRSWRLDGDRVELGGACVPYLEGHAEL